MNKYPTDEELELFISQMEQQELYAPKYMKEQILSQAFPKQTVEVLPKSGSSQGPVRLVAYRLKIIAGMAAAIFMLLVIPSLGMDSEYRMAKDMEDWEQEEAAWAKEQDGLYLNGLLNENAWRINQRINGWFGQMNGLQTGNRQELENGGNLDEN
ncbi:MAG: hypothetical protein K2H52_16810 [Lachnospiraceae bacterium]|nr:hypothetical protein [Lachnospiraceae bacterium]